MDYCFMGKKDEESQPIMVVKDRDSGAMCSFLVQKKGAAYDYVIKRTMAFIKELGYAAAKMIIKSDQESAIQSVVAKVIAQRTDQPTIPEHSPVRSSRSNGIIERGIKEVENQVRTMKSALDARLGSEIRASSNVLPWLVEFAAILVTRYLVGKDGKTPHERSRGKSSKMLDFDFGEQVHFRRIPFP